MPAGRGFSSTPSRIIMAAPPGAFSSPGWNTSFTVPLKPFLQTRQDLGHAQQRGRMHVVAAGVHHAGIGGSVGHVVGFSDGQGIHVGAEGYGAAPRVVAFHQSHHARAGNAFLRLEAQRTQLFGHEAGRIEFLEGQLGVGVQVTAGSYQVGGALPGQGFDLF
jgi:hypothetical protein